MIRLNIIRLNTTFLTIPRTICQLIVKKMRDYSIVKFFSSECSIKNWHVTNRFVFAVSAIIFIYLYMSNLVEFNMIFNIFRQHPPYYVQLCALKSCVPGLSFWDTGNDDHDDSSDGALLRCTCNERARLLVLGRVRIR